MDILPTIMAGSAIMHKCDVLTTPNHLHIYHRGPPLSEGPLPSFFYFALTGEESLGLDPYNQPVEHLVGEKIRIFSLTLPGHGPGYENSKAMSFWSKQIKGGEDLITQFIGQCVEALDFLIKEKLVDTRHIAAGGLSRGGFIASHFAARDERVKVILGFSPLTSLVTLEEFKTGEIPELAKQLSLTNQVEALVGKTVRFYIGNRDIWVSTDACYRFIRELTEASHERRHRGLPIELILFPSVGHRGHGTPPHIFRSGSDWLITLFASN